MHQSIQEQLIELVNKTHIHMDLIIQKSGHGRVSKYVFMVELSLFRPISSGFSVEVGLEAVIEHTYTCVLRSGNVQMTTLYYSPTPESIWGVHGLTKRRKREALLMLSSNLHHVLDCMSTVFTWS